MPAAPSSALSDALSSAEPGAVRPEVEPGPPGAGWEPPVDVHVAGLDAVGVAVAHALAGAGAHRMALWDPRPVDAADLGTGLLPGDLGRPRARALERRLLDVAPGLRVYAHHGPLPVLVGQASVAVGDVLDADLAAQALAADHPLLPVRVGPRAVTVGPWCAPGVVGCPLCSLPADPVGPPGRRSARGRATSSGESGAAAVDALTAQRAAVLVADALRAGPSAGVVRADRASGRTRRARVRPRAGCACDPDALAWGT